MKKPIENYYNLAVSDFDGTIFSSKTGIEPETLKAIADFRRAGGTFCICTGRMTSSIVKFYKQYGFSGYVISFNGAEICNTDNGEKVYKKHVDNSACVALLQYAEKLGKRIQVYPNDILTVNMLNDDYRAYALRCHVDLREIHGKVSELFISEGFSSGKVLFYTNDKERNTMLNDIKSIVGDRYEVICSNSEHIDVMAKGVSKGSAVQKLCHLLDIPTEKTICFGDETNDCDMIKIAGLGVVTANGNEKMKTIADIVAPSCEEGGVGVVLKKYGIH